MRDCNYIRTKGTGEPFCSFWRFSLGDGSAKNLELVHVEGEPEGTLRARPTPELCGVCEGYLVGPLAEGVRRNRERLDRIESALIKPDSTT
jgi:hypothetical protein